MTRFLDWLDEAAGGLIRVAYLVWGIVAVAAYFGDGTVPPTIAHTLAALAPWVLAFSVETHMYLTARRVRAAWQALQSATRGSAERGRAMGSMRVNLAILAGLLAFSMFNQLEYLAATWTPPQTALALPGPLAYLVRAIVVPAAFMAAAFLAPMGEGLPAQVQAEAHRFAAATFAVARRQWRARLAQMQQTGQDVTGALVQLVDDPAERRVIGTIHQAMYPATGALTRASLPAPSDLALNALPGYSGDPDDPPLPPLPTGPGSPLAAPDASKHAAPDRERAGSIHLVDAEPPRRRRTASAQSRVRRVLAMHPTISTRQLAKAAHVSDSTASKHRALWRAEREREPLAR